MIRKATATWKGTGRDGAGDLTTASGTLQHIPLTYKTRFEDAKGTNPEELIAAAHAGCFTMSVAFALQGAGFDAELLTTEAAVSLEADGAGFRIVSSSLALRASVPNITAEKFQELVSAAEKNCPVSKVLNATVSLDAALV